MYTIEQIQSSLSLPVCGGWDRGFLESILGQMGKGRALSTKQKETLGKVLARNTPIDQAEHERWRGIYLSDHKERAMVVATYYTKSPYFRDLSSDILRGEVPERKKFLKMIQNKYALKVLEEYDRAPRYAVGAYVAPRASFEFKHADFGTNTAPWTLSAEVVRKFTERGGFIMGVCSEIYAAAQGSKRYKILPVGATNPIIVEERRLKIKRN